MLQSIQLYNGLNGVVKRSKLEKLQTALNNDQQTYAFNIISRLLKQYPKSKKFDLEVVTKIFEQPNKELLSQLEYKAEDDEDETGLAKAVTPSDIYQMITDKMLALIKEASGSGYKKKWKAKAYGKGYLIPFNFESKKRYRGVNVFLLTEFQVIENPYFLTFKQIEKNKGKLKKGSKGYPVVYFTKLYKVKDVQKDIDFGTYNLKTAKAYAKKHGVDQDLIFYLPILKYYNVFNGKDIEGIDFDLDNFKTGYIENELPTAEHTNKLPVPEAIIANYPKPAPKYTYGGDRAFFRVNYPGLIKMPYLVDFETVQDYYRTFFHELSHSTGTVKRLERDMTGKFGSKKYAFEELVAEWGAVFLSAEAGIIYHNNNNHAEYLKNWNGALTHIKEDNRFIMRACTEAQKVADFILQHDENGDPKYLKDIKAVSEKLKTEKPKDKKENIIKIDKSIIKKLTQGKLRKNEKITLQIQNQRKVGLLELFDAHNKRKILIDSDLKQYFNAIGVEGWNNIYDKEDKELFYKIYGISIELDRNNAKNNRVKGISYYVLKQFSSSAYASKTPEENRKTALPFISFDYYLNNSRFYNSGKQKMLELPTGKKIILKSNATAKTYKSNSKEFIKKVYLKEKNLYEQNKMPIDINFFKTIALVTKDFDLAFEFVKNIKKVPSEVANQFRKKYDSKNKLTPKQAFKIFYDETIKFPLNKSKKTTEPKYSASEINKLKAKFLDLLSKSAVDRQAKTFLELLEKKASKKTEIANNLGDYLSGKTSTIKLKELLHLVGFDFYNNTHFNAFSTLDSLSIKTMEGTNKPKLSTKTTKSYPKTTKSQPKKAIETPEPKKDKNGQYALLGAKQKQNQKKNKGLKLSIQTIAPKTISKQPKELVKSVEKGFSHTPAPEVKALNNTAKPSAAKYKTAADLDNETKGPVNLYNIQGDLSKFLGKIEIKPVQSLLITLDTEEGGGKTHTFFQWANVFANAGYRPIIWSLEEHKTSEVSKSKSRKYFTPKAYNTIVVESENDGETGQQTYNRLIDSIKDFDVIFIDSLSKLIELNKSINVDQQLRKAFNGKLIFLIKQRTSSGAARGGTKAQFDGDIILKGIVDREDFRNNVIYNHKNRYNEFVPLRSLEYSPYYRKLVGNETPHQESQQEIQNKVMPKLIVKTLD